MKYKKISNNSLLLERTARTVSWKFAMQPAMVLLNEHNSETQNGVTTAESYVCALVLRAEIHQVQGHYQLEY
jgi:hypothetical protein